MPKRIVAGTVGTIALVACLFASIYGLEALHDARSAGIGALPWWDIVAELVMCSMALGALVIGFRFLDYAVTGRSRGVGGRWLRPILLGCGLFFPVFVSSLTVGINWAYRMAHGNQDQNALVALRVSFFLGIAAAVIGCGVLLRKARFRQRPG
jgi:hypothetical protein